MLKLVKALARRRLLLGLVAGLTVFGSVFAFAATLNVGTHSLSAGNAGVSTCDPDGVTATYSVAYNPALPGYAVNGVTVTGINHNCNGKTIAVTLTDGSNTDIADGSATFTASGTGDSQTLAFGAAQLSANPAASNVADVHAVING